MDLGKELLRWVPVGATPILNGVLRLMTYGKVTPEPAAGLISSASDLMLVAAYALLLQRWMPMERPGHRGLVWLTLTTFNHFLLGHFAFGLSAEQLIEKYNVASGQTWGVITLAIALAPTAAAKVLSARRTHGVEAGATGAEMPSRAK